MLCIIGEVIVYSDCYLPLNLLKKFNICNKIFGIAGRCRLVRLLQYLSLKVIVGGGRKDIYNLWYKEQILFHFGIRLPPKYLTLPSFPSSSSTLKKSLKWYFKIKCVRGRKSHVSAYLSLLLKGLHLISPSTIFWAIMFHYVLIQNRKPLLCGIFV